MRAPQGRLALPRDGVLRLGSAAQSWLSTTVSPLYALTIYPEWIYAILHLGKDVELRTWRPGRRHVGTRLVLHAGAYVGGSGPRAEGRANVRWFLRRVHEITGASPPIGWSTVAQDLRGRLAAVATLGEPTLSSPSPWSDPDGAVWAWPLLDVRPIVDGPVMRGGQGLWPIPASVVESCTLGEFIHAR